VYCKALKSMDDDQNEKESEKEDVKMKTTRRADENRRR
jgi:hypothetical protein